MPRVSVILPSYNHERFVGLALDSVLAQTYQDFEIVITDDGSTDRSVEVLTAYRQRDPRIKLFVNRVNYETHSVNNCIQHSSGQYIAMLASDDEFFPAKLERQVKILDDCPETVAVFTNARIVDEYGRDFGDPTHPYCTIFDQANRSRHMWLNQFFLKGNCLCQPSALIRRSVFETLGLYNPLLASLDDFELWVRLCLRHDIHVLPQKLMNLRVLSREANASGDTPDNFRRNQYEWIKILDHFQTSEGLAQLPEIFPEVADELRCEPDAVRRYVLARLALKAGHLAHRFWGIDVLYGLLSNAETRRQLAHRIGVAPEGEFVRMNGNLNPFAIGHRPVARVFWPVGGTYSETNSRSVYYPRSDWTELRIPVPAWDTSVPLRLDPCDFAGVVKISEVKLVCRTDGRCLWKHDLSKNAETIRLAGTALSLSDEHNLSILSTGNAPEIYLCDIPQLPDVPLELKVWIKAATDLAGAKQEVEDLRGAVAERDANLERLEAQAEALRAAIADRDGGKERLEAQAETLRAAIAERDADRESLKAQAEILRAAIAERDQVMQDFLTSRSWRYTHPLRVLKRLTGRK